MFSKSILYIGLFLCTCLLSACSTSLSSKPTFDADSRAARSARAHTELGSAYYQQGNYEIALSEFKIAIRSEPNYAAAYNGLGLVYSALRQTQQADNAFKRAIALNPNNSESQNNYGSFLCKIGRYDESIHHFIAATKNPLYKTPNIAYTNAGVCSLRNNNITAAKGYFYKALQLQPLTHPAAYQLADIQYKEGQPRAAMTTLRNTLAVASTPKRLWLGIQIARTLGDRNSEASYTIELRKRFPNSRQARMLKNELK